MTDMDGLEAEFNVDGLWAMMRAGRVRWRAVGGRMECKFFGSDEVRAVWGQWVHAHPKETRAAYFEWMRTLA